MVHREVEMNLCVCGKKFYFYEDMYYVRDIRMIVGVYNALWVLLLSASCRVRVNST